jgi:hypothetical protein
VIGWLAISLAFGQAATMDDVSSNCTPGYCQGAMCCAALPLCDSARQIRSGVRLT